MHVGIGVHVVCKIDMVEDEFSTQNSKEHLGTQCVYVYIIISLLRGVPPLEWMNVVCVHV